MTKPSMTPHYDSLETRAPEEREREFFGRLPEFVTLALSAPGWAKHLANVDICGLTSRAALAKLPVLRKADLARCQKEHPPFGASTFNRRRARCAVCLMSGPILRAEGDGSECGRPRARCSPPAPPGRDRAQLLLLSSHARRLHHGVRCARAFGARSFPPGTGNTEQQLEDRTLQASGYLGTPDFLKVLLDAAAKAGKDASSLVRGRRLGRGAAGIAAAGLATRGVAVAACYATADLGVIATRASARREDRQRDLRVEIVRPGTGDPVVEGEVGEVVVTAFNPDYPMIRLATGDLSAVLPAARPAAAAICGSRAGMAAPTIRESEGHVRDRAVAEIGKRHPSSGGFARCHAAPRAGRNDFASKELRVARRRA